MLARRAHGFDANEFVVFFHIAAVGIWKKVVEEMMLSFAQAGVSPKCCVLGSDDDLQWVKSQGLDVIYHSQNVREYEIPTLRKLWEWCHEHPRGAVLYCHTKGASMPLSDVHTAWRRLMTSMVIEPCKVLLPRLEIADLMGVSWEDNAQYPHFCGNFWMARADWINELDDPIHHRDAGGPTFFSHPWERMSSEMWVGSKPWHHVENLACRNASLWTDWILFEIDFPGSNAGRLRALAKQAEDYGCDSLSLYGGRFEGGARMQQNPREFARFLHFLESSKAGPYNNYLEIGAASGGSLRAIYDTVGFVDSSVIDSGACAAFELFHTNTKSISGLKCFKGDSRSPEAREFLQGEKFDLIGIDGDHSYEGVCSDWNMALAYAEPGALVWFHDTNWSPGVRKLLEEIGPRYETVFATDLPVVGDYSLGIRVIRV